MFSSHANLKVSTYFIAIFRSVPTSLVVIRFAEISITITVSIAMSLKFRLIYVEIFFRVFDRLNTPKTASTFRQRDKYAGSTEFDLQRNTKYGQRRWNSALVWELENYWEKSLGGLSQHFFESKCEIVVSCQRNTRLRALHHVIAKNRQ